MWIMNTIFAINQNSQLLLLEDVIIRQELELLSRMITFSTSRIYFLLLLINNALRSTMKATIAKGALSSGGS